MKEYNRIIPAGTFAAWHTGVSAEMSQVWDSHGLAYHMLDTDSWLTAEQVYAHTVKYAEDFQEPHEYRTLEECEDGLYQLEAVGLARSREEYRSHDADPKNL